MLHMTSKVNLFQNASKYLSSTRHFINYFKTLKGTFSSTFSLIGFFIFLVIVNQVISGTMLAFSLTNETLLIFCSREEEDSENMYCDDFFWLHERGVDYLFIFLFLHLYRKLFLNIADIEQETSWKTGALAFIIIQLVVFTGLVLCGTHLSDITLSIAVNALHSFTLNWGHLYWLFAPDKTLNCDTIMRLAYIHYILAFWVLYLGCIHGFEMHYDWKTHSEKISLKQEKNWWDEVFIVELNSLLKIILTISILVIFIYNEPEALSYEIFMWGDIGMVTQINFYTVAPHWYFRPYMGWLIICPYHYIGLFGLIYFFTIIYFQVTIAGSSLFTPTKNLKTWSFEYLFMFNGKKYKLKIFYIETILSIQYHFFFIFLIMCTYYSLSFLPYGRFYNQIGGNNIMLNSYIFIFIYLGLYHFRYSWTLNLERESQIN